jgi:WD40 repeat protein
VRAASFSADGKLVVSASDDGTARLWHASRTRETVILGGHNGGVRAASFSPDERRVVSAGDDGTVRIWRTDGSGEPLVLGGHDGQGAAA